MSIDYNYLRTLSPEEGIAYLRQALAGGLGEYTPGGEGSGFGEGAVSGEPGYYSALGRGVNVIDGWEGYGQLSEYDGVAPGTRRTRQALIEGPGGRSYVATFDDAGNLTDVGQQLEDSWYDTEVLGVPIGAFLPVAAAAAAAYAPGLLGEGAINGVSGEAVLTGGTGADTLSSGLYTLAPEGTSVTLGGSTTTLGGSGIGGSALGSGLTPGVSLGSGIGGGAIGSGLTVGGLTAGEIAAAAGASSMPAWLRPIADIVGGGRNLAGIAGAIAGAATSRSGTQSSTTSREPWGPAQDWMRDNIRYGQQLQQRYRDEPFSDLQRTAYRNFYSGLDSFNNTTAPGLLGWANSYMNGSRNFDPAAALSGFGGGLLGGGASPFGVPQMTSYSDALRRMWG